MLTDTSRYTPSTDQIHPPLQRVFPAVQREQEQVCWHTPKGETRVEVVSNEFSTPRDVAQDPDVEGVLVELKGELGRVREIFELQVVQESQAFSQFEGDIQSILSAAVAEGATTAREIREVVAAIQLAQQAYVNMIARYMEWRAVVHILEPNEDQHPVPSRFVTRGEGAPEVVRWSPEKDLAARVAKSSLTGT